MDRRRIRISQGLLFAAVGLLASACFERSLRPVNPCTRANVGETIRVQSVDEVDLLFMIDNSNSMAEEQATLTAELPRLVTILASGDRDADGTREFEPVRSMHIGVITSDMGTGGHMVPTCDRGTFGARFGDDGILITRGRTAITGCMATYPAIFDFTRMVTDPGTFSDDVSCVANTGTGGCGFEQQLEAVLKAISPSAPTDYTVPGYSPPIFHESSFGHADRENAGFIRQNSALAIIMVTDEEDCSAANPDIFNPSSPTYGGTDLNLRCFTYPETQHPIERYVAGVDGNGGLMGLRQNPNLLIFAGIVGIPTDAVPNPSAIDYEAILAHPDMMEVVDPAMPTRLRPSCNVPGLGIAFPPRRIVRTAQALQLAGASTTIQSICQASYSGALDAIIEKIADALGGACLPRDLNPDAEGFVGCQVFEILPTTGDITTCAGLPGRDDTTETTVMVNGVPHQMCEVIQVGPNGSTAGEQGWFYETAEQMIGGSDIATACGSEGQRIKFTFSPITNSDIRLECLQTVAPSAGGAIQIGTFCDPAPGGVNMCGTGSGPIAGHPLACDPGVRTCQIPCSETSNCTEAGLLGDVCDTRSWEEVVGGDTRQLEQLTAAGVDVTQPHNYCVNPTCI